MKMNSLSDCYILSNGVEIPCIGFGTWQTPDGEIAIKAVTNAIEVGYKHIDTAAAYGNEKSIGIAVKSNNIVSRENLFITSKLWNSKQGYENTLSAFDKTIKGLTASDILTYISYTGQLQKAMKKIGKKPFWRLGKLLKNSIKKVKFVQLV